MDVSAVAGLTFSLDSQFVLSKPTAGGDFLVRSVGAAVALPLFVTESAGAWLQHLLHSENPLMTVILCGPDAQWLFRVSRVNRLDASGRGDAALWGARIRPSLALSVLPDLLLFAHRNDLPRMSPEGLSPCMAGTPAPWSPSLLLAVLALATGIDPLPVVAEVAEAATLTELFDDGVNPPLLDFLCLLPSEWGGRPPSGRGVVISPGPWQSPLALFTLATSSADPATLDLSGLARLPGPPERRLALVLAVCDPTHSLPDALGGAETDWLLARGVRRPEILRAATDAALADLLARGAFAATDLLVLSAAQRAALDADQAAGLFRGETDGLARFVALFGSAAGARTDLLQPATAELLRWLQGNPDATLPVSPEESDLTALELVGALDLYALARLQAATSQTSARFQVALQTAGLPEAVADALLTGRELASAPLARPDPEPSAHWLLGIPSSHLVAAGAWASGDARWRAWWLDALRVHPQIADGSIGRLSGGWSEARRLWALGALRDGELTPAAVLTWFARERRKALADGMLGPALELLDSCGVPNTEWSRALLFDAPLPGFAPDPETLTALPLLRDAGLVDVPSVVKLVVAGAPLGLCRGLVPDACLALLDPSAAPPTAPPAGWDSSLTPLLAAQVVDPRFWQRWRDGPDDTLLGWLAGILGSAANATLLESVIAARRLDTPVPVETLALIAGALDCAAACYQALARAHGSAAERNRVLEIVGERIRLPLRSWLLAELTSCAETGAPPPLTFRERLALIDLLHPTRDVLRPVLASRQRVPEEAALLAALYTRLATVALVPPSPAPTPLQAALRPDWVACLATLPGWGHWSEALTTPSTAANGDPG